MVRVICKSCGHFFRYFTSHGDTIHIVSEDAVDGSEQKEENKYVDYVFLWFLFFVITLLYLYIF